MAPGETLEGIPGTVDQMDLACGVGFNVRPGRYQERGADSKFVFVIRPQLVDMVDADERNIEDRIVPQCPG
jgi:hypothetical protein